MVKGGGSAARRPGVQSWLQTFVTLSKSLHLSKRPFPHLQSGDDKQYLPHRSEDGEDGTSTWQSPGAWEVHGTCGLSLVLLLLGVECPAPHLEGTS